MKIKVCQKIDYIAEGLALLQHLGREEKYYILKEKIDKKYGSPFEEGLEKWKRLNQIEQEAEAVFLEDKEELCYYFGTEEDEDSICAGRLALLWEEFQKERFADIAALKAYLDGIPNNEFYKKFGMLLQTYKNIECDDSKMVKTNEPLAVISYLMQMEIKDEEKWKVQNIFIHRAEHQEKVLRLLEKACALLMRFQNEISFLTQGFVQYWEAMLQEENFADYIKDVIGVQIGDNPHGICLYPSVIRANAFIMYSNLEDDGKTYCGQDIYRMGILFGTDFDMRTRRSHQDIGYENYVMQVLKLLSDKSKFEILSYIHNKEAYGSELAKRLNLTTATVSHHMSALLAAALVNVTRRDKRVYYSANKEALAEVLDYCKNVLTDKS